MSESSERITASNAVGEWSGQWQFLGRPATFFLRLPPRGATAVLDFVDVPAGPIAAAVSSTSSAGTILDFAEVGVRLGLTEEPTTGALVARLLAADPVLSAGLNIPAVAHLVSFRQPRAPWEAPRLDARSRLVLDYQYEQPTAGIRWPNGVPSAASIDVGAITELVRLVLCGATPRLDGLLIVHRGNLVLEEYFRGFTPDTLHEVQSVTKSVTGLLVGIAIDLNLLDPDTAVRSFFEDRVQTRWVTESSDISVGHLLDMSAGIEWIEHIPYTDPRNDAVRMVEAENWVDYVLNRPASRPPGEIMYYNSGLSVLLGEVLARATGESVDDFASEHLFAPLDITEWSWLKSANGVQHTGGGLALRPLDMAKIGQTLLNDGRWNGNRVIPPGWVDRTLHARSERDPELLCSWWPAYSSQWWHRDFGPANQRQHAVCARGYGGQAICLVPDLEVVLVLTASNYEGTRLYADELLDQHLLLLLDEAAQRGQESAPPA